MTVSEIQILSTPGYCQLQAMVETVDPVIKPFLLWYRFPPDFERYLNSSSGNPFAAALLVPAMVTGETLEIQAPVSPELIKAFSTIQDMFQSWNQDFIKITVSAPVTSQSRQTNMEARTASFFSGGVDSFYTLLKNGQKKLKPGNEDDPINYLILIRGFDITVNAEGDELFENVSSAARIVGKNMRKEVLLIETNMKEYIDQFADWGHFTHGACLATA